MITQFGITLVENGWMVVGMPSTPEPTGLVQQVLAAQKPQQNIIRVAATFEEAIDQLRILAKKAERHRETQVKLEDDAS